MTPKTPRVSAGKVEKAHRRAGFRPIAQSGSHRRWAHPDGRRVVVPVHAGRDLPTGTLHAIIKQAKLDPASLAKRR